MPVIIIIFFIAIISLFGMIMFRTWEINKAKDSNPLPTRKIVPEVYFRHIEQIVLYLTKYIIQSVVFVVMKYWFIILTKTKKWIGKSLPKLYRFFYKESIKIETQNDSFFRKAILESKIKIRKIKENVRREHGERK